MIREIRDEDEVALADEQLYYIRLDEGRGGRTTILCDDGDEAALDWARDWARSGDWPSPPDGGPILVAISVARQDGEWDVEEEVEVDPPEPPLRPEEKFGWDRA